MFQRPTLAALVNRTLADLLSRLAAEDVLRRSDAEVYARVQAAAAHALYGMVDWASRQFLVTTCDDEQLDTHGGELGVARKPAAAATGTVAFTTLAGAVIPAGSLVRAFDGVEYSTDAEVTAVGVSTDAAVTATAAGAAGNRAAGQAVTLVSPVSGVQTSALAGELSGGADVETAAAYRSRLLARKRQPPHGGADFDYVAWALEVPGVTRAWCYPLELGAGTVVVRFTRDGDVSIIPDAGEVAAVQAYIDALRPVTAELTVLAPIATAQAFTVDLTPDTVATRAAVQAELAALLLREAEPNGTVLLSHIRAAISAAAGETNYVLTVPAADIVSVGGHITTLGVITWV